MCYAILLQIIGTQTEIRLDIRGTKELEKFTDGRICHIYEKGKVIPMTIGNVTINAKVKSVIKVYADSRCKVLAS
jgi:hypothetical protein